jgi:hypothetical protein
MFVTSIANLVMLIFVASRKNGMAPLIIASLIEG